MFDHNADYKERISFKKASSLKVSSILKIRIRKSFPLLFRNYQKLEDSL